MRTSIHVTSLTALLSAAALAQIPNGTFETWSSGEPAEWVTSNGIPSFTTVSQSSTAHGGSSAARGEVILFSATIIQPVLQSGTDGSGFPYTQRSANFTGYYQFSPVSGDRFGINVILMSGGNAIAIAAAALSTTVSSYSQFSVPFQYFSGATPDTCIVQIQIIGPGSGADATPHVGSFFLLDDIAFSGTTNVAGANVVSPIRFNLSEAFPNPFNPSTTISFSVETNGYTSLQVCNVLGQHVATLFEGTAEAGRSYQIRFDAKGLTSGVYFSVLESGGQRLMKRLLLVK